MPYDDADGLLSFLSSSLEVNEYFPLAVNFPFLNMFIRIKWSGKAGNKHCGNEVHDDSYDDEDALDVTKGKWKNSERVAAYY